jgi:LmbE family N-acetylglucosaminyl deacetylase
MRTVSRVVVAVLGSCLATESLSAQRRDAAEFAAAVDGIGVTARVLVIAAHPDDEDTPLITWLARGRQVETAYLSLTRGDGGQNLIGNELGSALGTIRTRELIAARRMDGGRQYFTRAFDFGYSKNAAETLTQWSRDSILRDVVTVVRAFRPHVIVSGFSGTPADGHGHHQVAGMLARDAWDVSGDTVRFPPAATAGYTGWTVPKFYRGASFRGQDRATIRLNVGEYSPLLGRSFAEIAAESRSQHRSQAFGSLQPRGPRFDQLMREATRVNEGQDAKSERSVFDGIDTTWARFRPAVRAPERRAALDSLPAALRDLRASVDLRRPSASIPGLARVQRHLDAVCGPASADNPCAGVAGDGSLRIRNVDLFASMEVASVRIQRALEIAAGIAIEATTTRALWATGERLPVSIAIYNRGAVAVRLERRVLLAPDAPPAFGPAQSLTIPPDSALRDSLATTIARISQPWWLSVARSGPMFALPGSPVEETGRRDGPTVVTTFVAGGATFSVFTPVVFRYADPIRGEINQPVSGAPAVTVLLDRDVEYAPATAAFEREVRVHVSSHADRRQLVDVSVTLPAGLTTTDAVQRFELARVGDMRTVIFTVRGRLAPGRHVLAATAIVDGVEFRTGFQEVTYEHIGIQRLYRPAALDLQAVDVRVARGMTVAYINGVGDNSAPMLSQLGLDVTIVDPATLGQLDLTTFRAVVVGTRAYEAHPDLVANNARLLEYARNGGTLVVQYGQYEMLNQGIMPYPITLSRPADRVAAENAPVRITDPTAAVLSSPNRITLADFEGWHQDRSLYMPRSFDRNYRSVLELNDPGERSNQGAILVAPYGRGTYVYTTLAFFRQLPNGVPGAARLFVNLLSARATGVAQ